VYDVLLTIFAHCFFFEMMKYNMLKSLAQEEQRLGERYMEFANKTDKQLN